MADKKPENPHAFPLRGTVLLNEGMSLRDYFAAHCPISFETFMNDFHQRAPGISSVEQYCGLRFAYADAMLKERTQ